MALAGGKFWSQSESNWRIRRGVSLASNGFTTIGPDLDILPLQLVLKTFQLPASVENETRDVAINGETVVKKECVCVWLKSGSKM